MNGERTLSPGEEARARNRKRKRREEKRLVPPSPLPSFPSFLARSRDRRRRRTTKTTSTTTTTTTREDAGRRAERGGANARRRKYWVYFEILFRCVGRATLLHAVHRVTHTPLSTSTQLHAPLSLFFFAMDGRCR